MRHRILSAVAATLVLPLLVSACNGPRVIHEQPVLSTGDRVASIDSAIVASRDRERVAQEQSQRTQSALDANAAAACAPAVCDALARGVVTLGMTEAQVMAATGSGASAWYVASQGSRSLMTPAAIERTPRDADGAIERVQLQDGRVVSVSWQGRAGPVVVSTAADTSRGARARAVADALVREGDDYIAAGDRTRALERYDRALVLRGDDALLNYKVAQLLDQQLRPTEALMRYQKFLLQMDLQRIEATGTQQAKLAEAIALAQQRVIVLDRRPR